MNEISATVVVRAPLTRVWSTLADVGSIAEWHPNVDASPVLSDQNTGLGATRRCVLSSGGTVVEQVTHVDDGRALTVAMSEHTMPLTDGTATFELAPNGDHTQVAMTMRYTMKFGPVGWLMNRLMLRPIMGKLLPNVLAGLDHHLVTGERVEQGWTPAPA